MEWHSTGSILFALGFLSLYDWIQLIVGSALLWLKHALQNIQATWPSSSLYIAIENILPFMFDFAYITRSPTTFSFFENANMGTNKDTIINNLVSHDFHNILICCFVVIKHCIKKTILNLNLNNLPTRISLHGLRKIYPFRMYFPIH